MRYNIFEIEQQLCDTLKGNPLLNGVTIAIHAGEVSQTALEKPEMLQTLIAMRRFILLQYLGKTSEKINSSRTETIHRLMFRFYVGSVDVFQLSLAREDAYKYLAAIYDSIQGKWLASAEYQRADSLQGLTGKPITGATTATPIVVTCLSHGKVSGDKIFIHHVGGNEAANNTPANPYWTVTRIDEHHLSLNGSQGNGAYTSGGSLLTALTSEGLNPQTGFIEVDGIDQRVVVDAPDLLIYQTDYTVKVLA